MGRRARSCVEVMLITEHIRGFEPRIEIRRAGGACAAATEVSRKIQLFGKFIPSLFSDRAFAAEARTGGPELEFRALLCCVDHKRNVCHGITGDDRVARGREGGGTRHWGEQDSGATEW